MSLRGMWREFRELVTGEFAGGTLTQPNASFLQAFGAMSSSGVTMSERIAEGLPAIYACVHVISETVGQLPLKLHRRLPQGGKSPDTDHPLYSILHDLPNPEMTAYQFREMVTRHLAIWGRAYAEVQRNGRGEVVALWPLHPSRMFVGRNELNQKTFKYWMGKGEYQTWVFDPDRPPILHLHLNSDVGLDGRSPLMINRDSLGITKATEDYTGAFFANGAVPGVVATAKHRLSPAAREHIRESWLARFSGAPNSHKLAVLEEGLTIETLGVDPDKSQLTALRSAQIEAAARIYRVPLPLIQEQTKTTTWGSGVEQLMLGFVNITMMPWFIQWQQAIKRDLLSRKSFETHDPVFVINSLVRGDIEKRYEAYRKARQNGWLNGDEIRELEDLNPIPGGVGKVFWMPANHLPTADIPVTVESQPEEPSGEPDESVTIN